MKVVLGLLVFLTAGFGLWSQVPDPCKADANHIILFRDANYKGPCCVRGIGNYAHCKSAGIPDNWVSSVIVGANVNVYFFEHGDFGGVSEVLYNSTPRLDNHRIGNDNVSSFRVERRTFPDTTTVAELFTDNNYRGASVKLSRGCYYNSNDIGLRGKSISSILTRGSKMRIVLYDDDFFMGDYRVINQNTPSLSRIGFNDRTSSIYIDSSNASVITRTRLQTQLIKKVIKPFKYGSEALSTFHQQHCARDVLGIIFDQHAPVVSPTVEEVKGMLHRVSDYFRENSNGRFTLNIVGVLGPYNGLLSNAAYNFDECINLPPGVKCRDLNGDGFTYGPHLKYREAITRASREFDFSKFDRNGDHAITTDELTIVICVPGSDALGFSLFANEREFPSKKRLKVNGIKFKDFCVELYMNSPPLNNSTKSYLIHEFGHLYLEHTDLYFAPNPILDYSPATYSPMGTSDLATHLDPFAKLKYGWILPIVITQSGAYQLEAIERGHTAWILMDQRKGSDEYFIIENRCREFIIHDPPMFDRDLLDTGLAIWHIIEKKSIWKEVQIPYPGFEKGDWGRRGLRLIRSSLPPNDSAALWHGPNPPSNQITGGLAWANGRWSGFGLIWISAAGQFMTAQIIVPPNFN